MDLKDRFHELIEKIRKEQQVEERMERIFTQIVPLIERLEETVVELRDEEDEQINRLERHILKVLESLSRIAEKQLDELNPMFKDIKSFSKEDAMMIEDVQNVFLHIYKHMKVLDQEIDDIVKKPVSNEKLNEIKKLISTIHDEFHKLMDETEEVERDVEKKAA